MENCIKIFKSLSDSTRIRILRLLLEADCELCICEIMDSLNLAQDNISKHTKELKSAGILKEMRLGRFVFYSIAKSNDNFKKKILEAVKNIPADHFMPDNKRLKKRLALRVGNKVVCGINGCK